MLAADSSGRCRPTSVSGWTSSPRARAAVILLSNRDSATFARRIDASLEPRLTPDFREGTAARRWSSVRESALGAVAAGRARPPQPPRADAAEVREPAGAAGRPAARASLSRSGGGAQPRRRCWRAGTTGCGASTWRSPPTSTTSACAPGRRRQHLQRRRRQRLGRRRAAGAGGGVQPAARPRPDRSLLFLVPSGEEKGLWGSAYYVEPSDGAARATSWPTSTWI